MPSQPNTKRSRAVKPKQQRGRNIDLALQGGGSHGAFTWGVLDRVLQEPDLTLSGISGTSAGAMNGAVLCTGFAHGGAEGARAALAAFWDDISRTGMAFAPPAWSPLLQWPPSGNLDETPWFGMLDMLTRVVSPYQLNPLDLNPLAEVLTRHVKLDQLQACHSIALFVTATSVWTGQPRVFGRNEVTHAALLASSCLPFLFKAVEIDGEPFWDGGYMGNPAIHPLIYNTEASDIVLVCVNPIRRETTPRTPLEIMYRLNEINFNSSLIAEMRAINFVSKLIRDNRLDEERYRRIRMHMVRDDDAMATFNASSRFNTHTGFIKTLFDIGYAAADRWFARHGGSIGHTETLDITAEFLTPR
jgi:NTE family protein